MISNRTLIQTVTQSGVTSPGRRAATTHRLRSTGCRRVRPDQRRIARLLPRRWQARGGCTSTRPTPQPFEPPGARAWPSSTWLGVILLAMAQAAPAAFVGDSALTGEGRLTALTMFDARAECHSRVTLHGGPPTLPPPAEQQVWDVRIRCDPLVHRAYIRHVCDHIFPATPGVTMDYRLKSRRSVDTTFVVIMDVKDACHADLSYAPWRHQPWILP